MLNDELVEEMYWLAHNSNVFDEFGKKIDDQPKNLAARA